MGAPGAADRWRARSPLLDRLFDAPAGERSALATELAGEDAALRAELQGWIAAAEASGVLDRTLEPFLAVVDEPGPDPAGRRVGAWRIVREIGRGGMGVVYEAERADGAFDRRVALKLLRRGVDTDEVLARFRREREILARLNHPHIARLLDGGATDEGLPYLVMEHVEGEPLTSWCEGRRLSVETRLRLLLDVCDAVDYAHRSLVVHRDLKPSNVLVTAAGEVKLLDFGIAKVLGPGDTEDERTRTGLRAMTPRYAAPEQVRGDAVTTATDTYALGLLLYELLTGRSPYRLARDTQGELERAVLDQDAEPPSRAAGALAGRLRGDLDAITLTALRKEPDRRYASASLLAEDVKRHLDGRPVAARPATALYRAGRFLKRHRLGVGAAVLVVASLLAGLAGTTWQARAKAREAAKAAAVRKYLVEIFQVSSPSESRGKTITAREILDRGAERIEKELAGEPEQRAEKQQVIGELYRTLGLLEEAEALVGKALAGKRALYGEEHAEYASALERWALALWDRGRYREAQEAARRSLEIRRRVLGRTHVLVGEALSSLASITSTLGEHDEAERLHREALEIDRTHYGPDHEAVAADLANIGSTLRYRGRGREGEPLMRESLEIRRRRLGPDHPTTLGSHLQIAVLLSSEGRYPEAEAEFRGLIPRLRSVYGAEHPEVAMALAGFSLLLQRQGEYSEAMEVGQEALAIRRKALGPEHPDLATSLNNLATLTYSAGDYEAAEHYLSEALPIWRSRLGTDHKDVASALNNLGMIKRARGDPEHGEPLVREALEIRRRVIANESPEVSQSLRNLGLVLMDKKGYAEAESALVESLELSRRVYPAGHPRQGEVLVALGDLRLLQGRADAAEPLLREAVELRREKLGAEHVETAAAEAALGCALVELHKPGAEPLLVAAVPLLAAARGQDEPAARAARCLKRARAG